MNPDTTNPVRQDEAQGVAPGVTPSVTEAAEVPAAAPPANPVVATAEPVPSVPELPTEELQPQSPNQPPATAPVIDTPQSTDQQVPVSALQPAVAAPSMGKKVIIAGGLIVLGLVALAVALTLL